MEMSKIVNPCYGPNAAAIENHAIYLFYGGGICVQNTWKKSGCKTAPTYIG